MDDEDFVRNTRRKSEDQELADILKQMFPWDDNDHVAMQQSHPSSAQQPKPKPEKELSFSALDGEQNEQSQLDTSQLLGDSLKSEVVLVSSTDSSDSLKSLSRDSAQPPLDFLVGTPVPVLPEKDYQPDSTEWIDDFHQTFQRNARWRLRIDASNEIKLLSYTQNRTLLLDKKNKGGKSLVLKCASTIKCNGDCPFYVKLRRSNIDSLWYICTGESYNIWHNCEEGIAGVGAVKFDDVREYMRTRRTCGATLPLTPDTLTVVTKDEDDDEEDEDDDASGGKQSPKRSPKRRLSGAYDFKA